MTRLLLAVTLATSCTTPAGQGVNAHKIQAKGTPLVGVTAPRPATTSPVPSQVGKRGAAPAKASRSRTGPNWPALAQCESSGNPRAVSPSGKYRGLYQFNRRTWRSVGGTGDPVDASAAEQTRRAELLYAARGRSPWPFCGRRL